MRRLLAFLLIAVTAFPQRPAPVDSSKPESSDFVVRINVNLVQVDAVVTDSKGHSVKGLTPEDFEVFQDGMPQKITNFNYVEEGMKVPVAAPVRKGEPSAVPPPPVQLKKEQVRRSIVLVVDDLGLTFENMAQVRAALRKFVDHDMQPGDLVAIVRTGAGVGALQQFTTDKRLLYAAIDQIKLSYLARTASFSPVDIARSLERPSVAGPGSSGADKESADYKRMAAADTCMNETMSALGSLAGMRYVIDGLRDMPGRKAMILISQNLQMQERPDRVGSDTECDRGDIKTILRRMADAAERSAVVIYTVDPRGVETLAPGADYNPFGGGPVKGSTAAANDILHQNISDRSVDYQFSQSGLIFLAHETGGTFASHNDIPGAIRDAVEDVSNFYVIGYHPPNGTFEGKTSFRNFHHITVKVKRSGLHVRTRNGFFGFEGQETNPSLTAAQQLARVLASPFAENDVRLRMTAFFSKADKPLLTTLLYLDAKDLTFTRQPDGKYQAALDAVAMTFDANGAAVNSNQRVYTFATTEKDYQRALENGVILSLQHPVLRPGAYQMRVAVRDEASGKLGSANQFIEVPNLKRGRLALSGIVLKQLTSDETANVAFVDNSQPRELELRTRTPRVITAISSPAVDPKGNEAIRIFKPGEKIGWFYQVFNAKSGSDQHANLNVQVRVFRDGKEVIQSDPAPARLPENTADQYVPASGHLQIGSKLTPGDYALQLIVTDNLAKKKYATASQWIDFSVENPPPQVTQN